MVNAGGHPIVVREETMAGGADHLRAACACDGAGGRHLIISALGVDLTAHADVESTATMLIFTQVYLGLAHTKLPKVVAGLHYATPHDPVKAKAYDGFGVVYLGQPAYTCTDDDRAAMLTWAAANPNVYVTPGIGDSVATVHAMISLIDAHLATHSWENGQLIFTSTPRQRRAQGDRPIDALRQAKLA